MSYKIDKIWDEDTGVSQVFITDKNQKVFSGMSTCHEEDSQFKSQSFGETIAMYRATIQFLRYVRDTEIKPQLAILEHLYSNMQTSKQFNPKSYEAQMLHRQICIQRNSLASTKEEIRILKDAIKENIKVKEQFNNLIRAKEIKK